MQGFTAFLIYISIFVKQKGIAMKTTAEIIEILRDYKARSAEKYGIETLGLFGSVARGEQNEKSDIDVFIKLRKTSYYTLMDIKDDLEQVFSASLTSLSYIDVKKLYPHHISENSDGRKFIRKEREKTGVEFSYKYHCGRFFVFRRKIEQDAIYL